MRLIGIEIFEDVQIDIAGIFLESIEQLPALFGHLSNDVVHNPPSTTRTPYAIN